MDTRKLAGKVVVITGASSGFGKGAALAFAQAGAHVVAAARRGEILDSLVADCQAKGGRALAVTTDVSRQDEVENLARKAVDRFDRIDIWINNAGVGALGRFWDIPLADHAHVIETNLLGTLYGSYMALRLFRDQGSGTLINTASSLGKMPAPYYSSYTASKYGIVGLGAALRRELSHSKYVNIHVCTVLPMAMDTPFFEHASNYSGHQARPIPPLYDPQEVIDTYLSLALEPKDEVIVGGAGKIMNALHGIVPGLIDGIMSRETHSVQIEKAPPAMKSSRSLHRPSTDGTGVYGGRLNR